MDQWIERETVFDGRVFQVDTGRVQLAGGSVARRDVVVHHGGVTIAAVTDEQVIMIRQFRIAVGEKLLELPAGMMEGDEAPQTRAATELLEETGYRAGRLRLVADYFVSPGYTTERMRLYIAEELTFEGQALDGDEAIDVVLVPLDEARRLLGEGEIRDAKTLIGLQLLFAQPAS
jgi:ADP-ribose pyrophosphatase